MAELLTALTPPRTQVQLPAPRSGSSQPPLPVDVMMPSDLHWHQQAHGAHKLIQANIHIYK